MVHIRNQTRNTSHPTNLPFPVQPTPSVSEGSGTRGREAFATTETQPHHPHPVGTVVYRYDGHDYGCSSDDTRWLGREYRAYTVNEDGSGPFFTHPVAALSLASGSNPHV